MPASADLFLAATPVAGLREVLQKKKTPLVWLCKGFEQGTGLLPHQIVEQTLGAGARCGALSGPSFAEEVARGLPCALTLAARDAGFAREAAAHRCTAGACACTTAPTWSASRSAAR